MHTALNCFSVEHRLRSSKLLQSDQHNSIENYYFSGLMYQMMEHYGGVQDDHIPFLQKGILFDFCVCSSSLSFFYHNAGI